MNPEKIEKAFWETFMEVVDKKFDDMQKAIERGDIDEANVTDDDFRLFLLEQAVEELKAL